MLNKLNFKLNLIFLSCVCLAIVFNEGLIEEEYWNLTDSDRLYGVDDANINYWTGVDQVFRNPSIYCPIIDVLHLFVIIGIIFKLETCIDRYKG